MDPNTTYNDLRDNVARMRELLDEIGDGDTPMNSSELLDVADSVAQDFMALDEWLRRGGFLPEDWRGGEEK